MIRPPLKCHEKSVHEFILHWWPFSQNMRSPTRIHARAQIIVSYLYLLSLIMYRFSPECTELYDTGKCAEFDRKLLKSFIMNDVI